MTFNPQIFIAIIIAIAVAVYLYKKRPIKDIDVPVPAVLRTDLLYGYFGTLRNQVDDTIGDVNLLWECMFEGHITATENILKMRLPTILDVQTRVLRKFAESGKNYEYNPDAVENMRALFEWLKKYNALQYIKAVVPIDEPNTNAKSEEDLQKAIDAIRLVAAEYPELADLKLCTVYAAKPTPFTLLDQFDWVGVDDYDSKSQIFVNGTYAELRKSLNKDQRTIILPGGAFGQDPVPFVNIAHTYPEVIAVVPFVYFGPMVPADTWVGIGDDKNPLKSTYRAVGRALIGAKP